MLSSRQGTSKVCSGTWCSESPTLPKKWPANELSPAHQESMMLGSALIFSSDESHLPWPDMTCPFSQALMAALKVTSSGSTSAASITWESPFWKKAGSRKKQLVTREFSMKDAFGVGNLPVENPVYTYVSGNSVLPIPKMLVSHILNPCSPSSRTSKKSSAKCHFPAFSRALKTALKVMMLALTPSRSMVSRSSRACSHCWPFSQALMAALKLITLASWVEAQTTLGIFGGNGSRQCVLLFQGQGGSHRQLRSLDSQPQLWFHVISATIFRVKSHTSTALRLFSE